MIRVDGLTLTAGAFALRGVSFHVPTGHYAVLMGRTGTGKSTILEAICGLRRVRAGTVQLMHRDVTRLKPAERGVGYVPQDRALFSTMTVRDHLAFSLSIRGMDAAAIARRVAELADLLGIGHLLHRRPAGLSGGEAQRVALGRALAFHPTILLLDEPLSALEDQTRAEMFVLLKSLQHRTGVTTLHVTHSAQEARELADCVLRLEDGAVRMGVSVQQPEPVS